MTLPSTRTPTPTTPSTTRTSSTSRRVLSAGAALLFSALCLGCPSEKKGPMERAGEAVDEAAEDVKSAVQDAFDDDGPLERGGEALDDAGESVKSTFEEAKEDLKDSTKE